MLYTAIKHLHMLAAVISILGFIARGALRFQGSALLEKKAVKILPHINDTILLLCGFTLAAMIGAQSGGHTWLAAKLVALVLYILLGMVTLKWAPNHTVRAISFTAAILVFGYIMMVARTKMAFPF
ncbi:MAG: SirB2 family protein [Pseudomonadales bacterium]|nr:SirB2 family protein [Pseudomonadales bacterium]